MFDDLSQKFDDIFRRIKGEGILSETNIQNAMQEIQTALLEADVNYKVVKDLVKKIERQAIGQKVSKSIQPGQQVVKIVHDELKILLGNVNTQVKMANIPPTVILLCGLQGSGKTTFAGKLAHEFKTKNRHPLLVAADVYRPAAKEQLKQIGKQVSVDVFANDSNNAVSIASDSFQYARKHGKDVLIIDTAGRLHIDETLMKELQNIKREIKPHEILFVADGMLGQDAVQTAKEFANKITYDGVVLTKMDGDTRGGAALSIKAVTGKPIKYVSNGEKMTDLELFHPERYASRILGMGDIVSLVEKAQASIDAETAKKMQTKLFQNQFNLQDFLDQLRQIQKMGPMEDLLKMIPGMSAQMRNMPYDPKAIKKTEAIICSMTKKERQQPDILNGNRRRRIADGSGTRVQDINQLLNQFEQMKKMMKNFKNNRFSGLMPKSLKPF